MPLYGGRLREECRRPGFWIIEDWWVKRVRKDRWLATREGETALDGETLDSVREKIRRWMLQPRKQES